MTITYTDYEAAVKFLKNRVAISPKIGIILGSGLGELANCVEDAIVMPYADIPKWPTGSVKGHASRLAIGYLEGQTVIVMQGRAHFYEGVSMQAIGFPIRVMQLLGVHTLVVTNAAGGLNPQFKAGDLMIISDHINMPGMAGHSPLIGPNDSRLGPRFPILKNAYTKNLREFALNIAKQEDIRVQQGIYIGLAGPAFETPAEIRMIRSWGADAVGMSTVHEVVVACHAGLQVLGISSITNTAIDNIDSLQETSHEEVLEMGYLIVPKLVAFLKAILRDISS